MHMLPLNINKSNISLTSENYYALYLSIVSYLTPEQAFALLETGVKKRLLGEQDTIDMKKMRRQGWTFKDIAEAYGIKDSTVYKRLKNYDKKQHQLYMIAS